MTGFDVGAQLSLDRDTLSPGVQKLIIQLNQLNQTFININQKVSQTFIEIDRSVTTTINNIGRQVTVLDGLLTKITAFFAAFKSIQFVRDAVNEFAEFERGIALVAAQAEKSKISLDEVRDSILKISRETGRPFTELNRALRDTVSSGVELSEALKVVRVAAEFAAAGGTTVDDAVRGIITAITAFELSTADATRVADTFFQAMKTGRATAAELARFLGIVASDAHAAGLTLDETVNAINALTLSGLSAERATTSLRSAINSILRPSEEAQDIASRLGINFTAAGLAAKGLAGFLQDVTAKTEGDSFAISKLFGNYRAYTAILAATANNQNALTQGFDLLREKAGALGRAFGIVGESFAITQDRFFRSFEALQVNFGRAAEPLLTAITKLLTDFFDLIAKNEGRLRSFFEGAVISIERFGKAAKTAFEKGEFLKFLGEFTGAFTLFISGLIATAIPFLAEVGKQLGKTLLQGFIRGLAPGQSDDVTRAVRDSLATALKLTEKEIADVRAESLRPGRGDLELEATDRRLEELRTRAIKLRSEIAAANRALPEDNIAASIEASAKVMLGHQRELLEATLGALEGDQAKARASQAGESIGKAILEGIKKIAPSWLQSLTAPLPKAATTSGATQSSVINTAVAEQQLISGITKVTIAEQKLQEARRVTSDLLSKNLITSKEANDKNVASLEETKAAFTEIDAVIAKLTPTQRAELGKLLERVESIRLRTKETTNEFDNLGTGIVQGLRAATDTLADLNKLGIQLGETLANSFADLVVQFARGQRAFSQFAGEFLQKIGEMILKAAIFRLIQSGIALFGTTSDSGLSSAQSGAGQAPRGPNTAGFEDGGWIDGPDTRRDSTLIAAMPGEFMVRRAAATDYYGGGIMQAINDMVIPRDALIPYATNLRMNLGTGRATGGFAPSATLPAAGGTARSYMFPDEQAAERTLAAAPEVYTRFMREHRSALGYGSGRTR